jgi:NAD(P)-dependent dehydrogenase (short-subunit alcohol dehydrogenase family)
MAAPLQGQVAVITGGARGQGRRHALALARAGAAIALVDVPEGLDCVGYPLAGQADLDATVAEVQKCDVPCLGYAADVRDLTALEHVVADVTAELGPISILVANAGVMVMAPIHRMTSDQWEQTIGTNLTGVFNSIRAVSPLMRANRYGRIVVVASSLARTTSRNSAAYVASKWGVVGLTKAAAHDLATFGVTVNGVAPGSVMSPMVDNEQLARLFRPELEQPTIDDALPLLAQLNPMGVPLLDADEISRVVLFLVDPASRHISGTIVDVNAGSSALYTA